MLVDVSPEVVEKITLQGLIAAFEVCDDPVATDALLRSIRHFCSPSQWREFRQHYE